MFSQSMHQFHLKKRTFVGENADVLTKKALLKIFNDFNSQTKRAGFGAVARALAFHQCGLGSIPCPPVWPGFDSLSRRHIWTELIGSLLGSERLLPGYTAVFPSHQNTKKKLIDLL